MSPRRHLALGLFFLAVVGILAAIALPSYSEYVMRGKVREATSKLADHRGVRFPTMFESGPQGRAMNSLRLDQPPFALVLDAEGRLREVLTDPSQLESTVRSYLRDRPIAEGGAITNQ